jgi:hypothetical protein
MQRNVNSMIECKGLDSASFVLGTVAGWTVGDCQIYRGRYRKVIAINMLQPSRRIG